MWSDIQREAIDACRLRGTDVVGPILERLVVGESNLRFQSTVSK